MKRGIKKFFSYFKEVLEETRKVSWPNRKTTTRYSILVVLVAGFTALFFVILDTLFTGGLEGLLKIAG